MKKHLGIVALATVSGMIAAGAVQSLFSAYAVQNELVPPTSGIYTGVQFSQKLGDAFKSLASGNKGNTAPANVEGATVDGLGFDAYKARASPLERECRKKNCWNLPEQ